LFPDGFAEPRIDFAHRKLNGREVTVIALLQRGGA
jgi:hypothetical protein